MAYAELIEIFLVNGTADSLIIAELSNWNGKAIKIPRIELAEYNRDELVQPGVYFLFCKEDSGKDSVYIGESENVKERLMQHIRDYQANKEQYYWNTAVVFTGRDLNKASIRYLENRLVEIAKEANRYIMLTKNTFQNTVMKEPHIISMERFIANVKILIPVLGFPVLEPLLKDNRTNKKNDRFYLTRNGNKGIGERTAEGFLLLKGSSIAIDELPSCPKSIRKQRSKAKREGTISTDGKVLEDILFGSPSSAASFAVGGSANGLLEWKLENGKTIKEIDTELFKTNDTI